MSIRNIRLKGGMIMFSYKKFENLCKKKGVSVYFVANSTGIATSTLSNWKNGVYVPKIDKIQKIADFFNVTIEYFLKG